MEMASWGGELHQAYIDKEQNLAWETVALKFILMQCRGWQTSVCYFLAFKPEVKSKDNNSGAGGGGKDNTNTQVLCI